MDNSTTKLTIEECEMYADTPASTLFDKVLQCESILSAAKTELQKATTLFGQAVNGAQKKLDDAWKEVEAYMSSTSEYELEFPAPEGLKYVVGWSTPRQSVKVTDVDALPDDLVKIEKKPKLREIGERLKQGWQTNAAKFELGEKHLQWRTVKSKGEYNEHSN
jgi:hypothetical protein